MMVAGAQQIRVAIVDDHAIVRSGLARMLALEPGVVVAAEFADGEQAYNALGSDMAEVVILDISMPGRDGFSILRRLKIRQPEMRVIIFSMHDGAAMLQQALRAGADGYFSKATSSPDELVAAIARVAQGERVIATELVGLARADGGAGNESPAGQLTPREYEVFRLMAAGASVTAIADRLSLSAKTVSNYQTLIRQKLGVESAVDLLKLAEQLESHQALR